MYFSEIIRELKDCSAIVSAGTGENMSVREVMLLDGRQSEYDRNTLYFGYENQLRPGSVPAQCVLEGDGTSPAACEAVNCAFTAAGGLFAAFNAARERLHNTRRGGLYEDMLHIAEQSGDLRQVLDEAARRLGNALVLVDRDYRVLEYSASFPILDAIWTENVARGYCSYAFIQAVHEMGLHQRATGSGSPADVSCSESPYRKYCCRIEPRVIYAGFLLMITGYFTDQPADGALPELLERFSVVAQAVTYLIPTVLPRLMQGQSATQKLLYELLIGAPPEALTEDIGDLRFPPRLLAGAVVPDNPAGRDRLAAGITDLVPGCGVIRHEGGLALLIPLEGAPVPMEALEALCLREKAQLGLSNAFDHIMDFAFAYGQAKAALNLARQAGRGGPVCRYIDYQVYDLLRHCAEPRALRRYCHPALAALTDYDRENNAELARTLRIYLFNGCSIKDAARDLFIHRNSVVYRLEKAAELTGIDLNDPQTRLLLQLSFLIGDLSGSAR